jgi:hypothetical protein
MEEQIDRVWDIVEKVGVCMLTTQSSDRLRARPVEGEVETRHRRDLCRNRHPQHEG